VCVCVEFWRLRRYTGGEPVVSVLSSSSMLGEGGGNHPALTTT
jgi:hypothetical protein